MATALSFCLYPAVAGTVSALNEGVSEGPGYYNPYTRFIPAPFEEGIAVALDLALSCLVTAGLFYGAAQWKQRRAGQPPTTGGELPKSTAKTGFVRIKPRLWLIPVWFVAQFLWNLISGMPAGQSLGAMTSLNSLWISAVVITVIVLYALNYRLEFDKKENRPAKPSVREKQN